MKTLVHTPLDRTRQTAPQVLERLREAILSLDLPPGTLLSRQELADQFGVSQTPVREALLRLSEEGLVEVYPQHATLVSRIQIRAARQAQFLRRSIELEIVRTLAQAAPEGLIDALEQSIALQQRLAREERLGPFMASDHAFHHTLYVAAGVTELWDVVARSSGHVDRLRRLHLPSQGKVAEIVKGHAEIVQAIARRDAAAAEDALHRHLSGTLSVVDAICAMYPDYVDRRNDAAI